MQNKSTAQELAEAVTKFNDNGYAAAATFVMPNGIDGQQEEKAYFQIDAIKLFYPHADRVIPVERLTLRSDNPRRLRQMAVWIINGLAGFE